ncbi:SIS domain-containing protein [Plantibacter sp. YIM 135249]|uniref:SIS domain-containing protein n=1 Tax=Plantibacter sp. YIM 135249 TaxID=3423918 RepID=UPI003D34234F
MHGDYIAYETARAAQADRLQTAVATISEQVLRRQAAGELTGPGPIFVGIGASLAAACAPVWALRSREIHSWRLGAGDLPLPFPAADNPIIGISQSGRSSETIAVLRSVEESRRYAVVNNVPSPLAELVERTITLGTIPDSYASTIGYTATVVALGMIAEAWNGGALDPEWEQLHLDFRQAEQDLAAPLAEVAKLFVDTPSVDFVGTGPAVGSAEAGALLFREVARIHSTAMSTRQYLHGSMESAGDGVHVLFGDERELEVARTLSEAGHQVVLFSNEDVTPTEHLHIVRLPKLGASRRAIIEALAMQILVGEVAALRGVDIEEFVFHNSDTKVVEAEPSGSAS